MPRKKQVEYTHFAIDKVQRCYFSRNCKEPAEKVYVIIVSKSPIHVDIVSVCKSHFLSTLNSYKTKFEVKYLGDVLIYDKTEDKRKTPKRKVEIEVLPQDMSDTVRLKVIKTEIHEAMSEDRQMLIEAVSKGYEEVVLI